VQVSCAWASPRVWLARVCSPLCSCYAAMASIEPSKYLSLDESKQFSFFLLFSCGRTRGRRPVADAGEWTREVSGGNSIDDMTSCSIAESATDACQCASIASPKVIKRPQAMSRWILLDLCIETNTSSVFDIVENLPVPSGQSPRNQCRPKFSRS